MDRPTIGVRPVPKAPASGAAVGVRPSYGEGSPHWRPAVAETARRADPRALLARLLGPYHDVLVLGRPTGRPRGPAPSGRIVVEARRPSVVGNLVFLVSMSALALWGLVLAGYAIKCYLGIDLFPEISLSRTLHF